MEIGSRLAFSLQFCVVTSCRLSVGETADCQSALRRWSRYGSRKRFCPPARQRRRLREAEGRGRCRDSGGHQRAASLTAAAPPSFQQKPIWQAEPLTIASVRHHENLNETVSPNGVC